MRRVLSVFLIIVFCYHFMGSWMTFKAIQYQVRKEIKQKIKNAIPLSEQIVFQEHLLSSVEWVKPKKEFRFQDGSMYDVLRKEGSQYYCIRDTQEEQLFKYLDDLVSQQMHQSSSKSAPIQKVFKTFKPDFTSERLSILPLPSFFRSTFGFLDIETKLLSLSMAIHSPPPLVF